MTGSDLEAMLVSEVMEMWPETIHVFLRRRMHCPGCLMAPFMTVAHAAAEYGIPTRELVQDLQAAQFAGAKPEET